MAAAASVEWASSQRPDPAAARTRDSQARTPGCGANRASICGASGSATIRLEAAARQAGEHAHICHIHDKRDNVARTGVCGITGQGE